jgi:hypothetical protein
MGRWHTKVAARSHSTRVRASTDAGATLVTRPREDGFTLVELLITVVILPLIIGAIAVALVTIFNLQTGVSNRITGSGDAQVVSASFFHDLQSAEKVTVNPANPSGCGAGSNELIGLQWSRSGGTTNVAYDVTASGSTFSMVRYLCDANGTSTQILSANVPSLATIAAASQICINLVCHTFANTALGWISTAGMKVTLGVTEPPIATGSNPGSSYTYNLSAAPRSWGAISGVPNLSNTPFIMLGSGNVVNCGGNSNLTINGPALLNTASGNTVVSTNGIGAVSATSWTNVSGTSTNFSGNVSPSTSSTIPAPLPDPYGSLTSLTPSGPALNSTSSPMVPGYYPGNVNINVGSGTFIFGSGTYFFGGKVTITGGSGSTIESAPGGVLLYVDSGSFSLNTSGILNLSPYDGAPQSESGLTIWQPKSNTNPMSIAASGSGTIQGVIYAPGASITGNGSTSFSVATILAQSYSCGGGNALQVG